MSPKWYAVKDFFEVRAMFRYESDAILFALEYSPQLTIVPIYEALI